VTEQFWRSSLLRAGVCWQGEPSESGAHDQSAQTAACCAGANSTFEIFSISITPGQPLPVKRCATSRTVTGLHSSRSATVCHGRPGFARLRAVGRDNRALRDRLDQTQAMVERLERRLSVALAAFTRQQPELPSDG
jgi:hypothetical protein